MLAIFPVIALLLLFLILYNKENDCRHFVLNSLIIWGVILTEITEFCSWLKILELKWLTWAWLLIDIVLILIYLQRSRKKIKPELKKIFNAPFSSLILLGGIVSIVIAIGLVAIVAAPNHSDSMEYHMSRIVHWIQNHSVTHYPTSALDQLYQNPWSEFAIMHFQILSGGDRFANLIQWSSMVGSIIGISLIARQLGANLRGQILAAVFCVTLPMGILQGSSTNNDLVVGLWLVCLAYFTLLTVKEGISLVTTFFLGASLGLAILTKGTAYLYALPFCIWLILWGIKHLRWQVWQPILFVAFVVLLLDFGHYTRNLMVFGSFLGGGTKENNEIFSLAVFISSMLKNLALHADIVRHLGLEKIVTPTTGITEKIIKIIHGYIGIDINDPRLMNPKSPTFHVPKLSTYEDTAGDPIHLALILVSFIFLTINKNLRNQAYLARYFWAVSSGFFIFCFLFTWSPWRCRLHLPLFVLFSAFVGVILSKSLDRKTTTFCAIILLFLSHPWVINNSTRPLIGKHNIFAVERIDQYFVTQPHYEIPYIEAANVVTSQKCSNVGLILTGTSFEYPLWVSFQRKNQKVNIRHINVNNASSSQANKSDGETTPCAIISIDRYKIATKKNLVAENINYREYWSKNWSKGLIQVFIPRSSFQ